MSNFLKSLLLVVVATSTAHGQTVNNVKLPDGFKMELYADETLANDIQAMTLDSLGRVVVTGPGYVKILHHDKTTGRASHATTYATPKTGGMGLWFEGRDLLITAEGWLSRYRDQNADDVADGLPEHILPFAFQEHGGHAIRKGPDGWFYVIGGNDAGIDTRHIRGLDSPIKEPQAGGFVRISPDLKQSEVIAHGFRNPYDFDFNEFGDIFTYDSDCERDEFLPWYTPTRVFHVAEGGHHGWRLKGYLRCFARKPDLFDTVGPLVDIGRGSPTGVVAYRHRWGFMAPYNQGLFILDWTFGRIFFLPLKPSGDSYESKAEVFLDPIGGDGFAPTDICVGRDGTLFVTIGGRKTRGSVYRISRSREPVKVKPPITGIDAVLTAEQPLDSWSRAKWEPLAKKLGREPFATAAAEASKPELLRIRAIEILVDLFDGLAPDEAETAWKTASDMTRARIAWSLTRKPHPTRRSLDLANDRDNPRVRIALAELAAADGPVDAEAVYQNLIKHSSQHVGPAVALLERKLKDRAAASGITANINHALAKYRNEPTPENSEKAIQAALRAFTGTAVDRQNALDATRLIIVALGDWDLEKAEADVFTSYTLAAPSSQITRQRDAILKAIRPNLTSDHTPLNREVERLLAMLGDDAPETRELVAKAITSSTTATQDIHALIVLDRLQSPITETQARTMAGSILAIDGKLNGQTGKTKQSWNLRMTELLASYSRKYPQVIELLVKSPGFMSKTKVEWFTRLEPASRTLVARAFFEEAIKNPTPPFSVDDTIFDLFDGLPAGQVAEAIRKHPDWITTGAGALKRLAIHPIEADRPLFVRSLDARDPAVAEAALAGLEQLPQSTNPRELIPAFSLLRRLIGAPTAKALRMRTAAYIARESKLQPLAQEPNDTGKVMSHYAPFFAAFQKQHPDLANAIELPKPVDLAAIKGLLKDVNWSTGNIERGAVAFKTFQCASCHSGAALGPDLKGAAKRFSRDDLFGAIVDPARDVAPAYRPLLVLTKDGKTRNGFLTFESAEGIILQTGPAAVERISAADIEERRPGDGSLMPNNLLQGAKPQDLADLYAYLNSL